MFSDFKNLSFLNTINKLTILFNIYRRLDLLNLENQYRKLISKCDELDKKINSLAEREEVIVPIQPPIEPPITSGVDLIIDRIEVDKYFNGPPYYTIHYIFSVHVMNIGSERSTPTTFDFNIPGRHIFTHIQGSLDPGQRAFWGWSLVTQSMGNIVSYNCFAEINKNRECIEYNYNNNKKYIMLDLYDDFISTSHVYFTIHAHNPEGYEIGCLMNPTYLYTNGVVNFTPHQQTTSPISIYDSEYSPLASAKIYINNIYISESATDISEHNKIYDLLSFGFEPGTYPVRAEWNGMTVDLGNITFALDDTIDLIFVFPRTSQNLDYNFDFSSTYNLPLYPIINSASPYIHEYLKYMSFNARFITGFSGVSDPVFGTYSFKLSPTHYSFKVTSNEKEHNNLFVQYNFRSIQNETDSCLFNANNTFNYWIATTKGVSGNRIRPTLYMYDSSIDTPIPYINNPLNVAILNCPFSPTSTIAKGIFSSRKNYNVIYPNDIYDGFGIHIIASSDISSFTIVSVPYHDNELVEAW